MRDVETWRVTFTGSVTLLPRRVSRLFFSPNLEGGEQGRREGSITRCHEGVKKNRGKLRTDKISPVRVTVYRRSAYRMATLYANRAAIFDGNYN